MEKNKVYIIGAGLAGCESALVLAREGIDVVIFEARPRVMTPAHKTSLPAELVCSNSFKSDSLPSAHALLKLELKILKSPLLEAAYFTTVPAGSALAVDRERFSLKVKELLSSYSNITYIEKEVTEPPDDGYTIIAAGPLVSENLTNWLLKTFPTKSLHFYDAIAPIISADSIDYSKTFFASRRDVESKDYLNCPFTEEEYRIFYEELSKADRVVAHEFENEAFFEGCLPIEVIARRGYLSLVFGPLRPVGLIDPATCKRPFAVCQLRKEDLYGHSYNMVGFQTRLKVGEQKRVFRLIPGLKDAEFLRFGSIHRNTYLDSPSLLNSDFSFKKINNLFLSGQLCGNEGYTESIATGHLAALAILCRLRKLNWVPPPPVTAVGALLKYITTNTSSQFTPSNIHFGLFPPLENINSRINKKEKYRLLCRRAEQELSLWKDKLLNKK